MRRGVTLIELLVAVGVVAVLVSVLIAAVQKARLSARQAENRNQVRQMLTALHRYSAERGGSLPGDENYPGFFLRLVLSGPYFDLKRVSLNYVSATPDPPGVRPKTVIGLYVNPSDPSWTYYTAGHRMPVGDCGYGANAVAFVPKARLDTSFADGTSNTLAVAERYARCRNDNDPRKGNTCWSQAHTGPSQNGRTPTFADKFYDDTIPATKDGRTTGSRPGRPFQLAPSPPDCDPFVPQATTPGGLVVGMVDGSVRTVGGGVNPDLFWAAVTPAAGDIGSLDD